MFESEPIQSLFSDIMILFGFIVTMHGSFFVFAGRNTSWISERTKTRGSLLKFLGEMTFTVLAEVITVREVLLLMCIYGVPFCDAVYRMVEKFGDHLYKEEN